jgi:hypothetical protein
VDIRAGLGASASTGIRTPIARLSSPYPIHYADCVVPFILIVLWKQFAVLQYVI